MWLFVTVQEAPGKGGTNSQPVRNGYLLGSDPRRFRLFSYSSGPLKICSEAIRACQLEADATFI